MIWLTIMAYSPLEWQWIFCHVNLFLPPSPTRLLSVITMGNMTDVIKTGTDCPSREPAGVHVAHLYLVFCVGLFLVRLRSASCAQCASVAGFSILDFL